MKQKELAINDLKKQKKMKKIHQLTSDRISGGQKEPSNKIVEPKTAIQKTVHSDLWSKIGI